MFHKGLIGAFVGDRKASVAPMLALASLPLFGLMGAAVDFSRAASTRTAMQAALDASALMLSKDATALSAGALTQKSQDYFKTMFTRPEANNVQVSMQFTQPQAGSYLLKMTGSATVNTLFSRMLGQSTINLSTSSEVSWGIKKLNLALVLDNTGSMSQNQKMTNLKTAAHNLLTTLQNAAKQPGDIQVAIVPFATDVNVGTSNAGAYWVDWTDWDAANGKCSNTSYTTKSSCTSHSKVWTPAAHSTWNGCVYDRDQNNDVTNTATVAGAPATLYRAHQASNCPTSMMPLSTDWTALNNKIDAMTPTGNTNVTVGLSMGFQLISPVAPFNAPQPAPDLDKVIVILTDGLNTQNRWTSSESSIDARTQLACNNIKAANIKLYTVRVLDGDVALLQGCATKPSMYYDVQQASQLNSAFGSIAQNLANLRIAQ
ncbi:vWA domain-containing protein [Rhodoplanes sp. Z2-YC6860]|uniref:vWA domain-containing protein n=1 Tax=Rhodoplanes sp. Z2-YC6860 TaxID=674703 RepID=UPI00078E75C4|nr:pilus assembly protein [Rhodoplanes sp. Z2-YC6860]AMN42476.1 Flp pilus assembly protein TadG [Rhodoplanes sp. Z2-YC6860]